MRLPNVYLSLFDRGGSIDTGGNQPPEPPVSCAFNVTAIKTSDYTAAVRDLVRGDPSGGYFTVTAPSGAAAGDWFIVKNVTSSATTIIVSPSAAETFDGEAVYYLTASWGENMFVNDGANWMVF